MATWAELAEVVSELPLTVEQAPHDWRVGRKLLAWERPLRTSDIDALGPDAPTGDIVGIRVADEGVKFALIADEPDIFFTTPHFDGHPVVLARLSGLDTLALRELLTEAWLSRAPKSLVAEFLADQA